MAVYHLYCVLFTDWVGVPRLTQMMVVSQVRTLSVKGLQLGRRKCISSLPALIMP